jgi:hypothetical protein
MGGSLKRAWTQSEQDARLEENKEEARSFRTGNIDPKTGLTIGPDPEPQTPSRSNPVLEHIVAQYYASKRAELLPFVNQYYCPRGP